MSINQALQSKCQLCYPSNIQSKHILRVFCVGLKQVFGKGTFQATQGDRQFGDMEGFIQLATMIQLRSQGKGRKTESCKHMKLFKHLQRAINCSADTLDHLCALLAISISQKRYQLCLLEQQVLFLQNIVQKHHYVYYKITATPNPNFKNLIKSNLEARATYVARCRPMFDDVEYEHNLRLIRSESSIQHLLSYALLLLPEALIIQSFIPSPFDNKVINMDSLVDHNAQYNDLLNYFSSYLKDMAVMIGQVKALTYCLLNVPPPSNKNIAITPDVYSVMGACKRTHDDIKRIQSILRGHVKGKGSETQSPAIAKTQPLSARKLASPPMKYQQQAKDDQLLELQKKSQSPSTVNYESIQPSTLLKKQIQQLSSSTPIQIPDRETISNQNETTSNMRSHSSVIEQKIENMRTSRRKDLKQLQTQNDECLSIIRKIREELNIKKK